MKALQLREVGSISVTDLDDPIPDGADLLVEVTAAGMCGSDRHLVSGEYPGQPPVILGHEFEGVVLGGATDERVKVGDRVTVDPNIPCGVCLFCVRGLVAHCSNLSAYGVDRDGGFAQLVRARASQAHVISPTVPELHGALSEPLSCCLRGMDHANVQPGDRVAVIGGGVMGQLLVQLVRMAGATEVILSTRQQARRDLAESLGATKSIDPSDQDPRDVIAAAGGLVPGGVDIVLDAAGAAGSFEQALSIVRPAGTVVVVGAAPQDLQAQISPFDIFARELRILGSHLNPFTHARAAALIATGALQIAALITRVVDLDELSKALQRSAEPGDVKILVKPS